MKKLSIEIIHNVQGGGLYSYFYNWGYQSRMSEGSDYIILDPVYVGNQEALLVFHEKIRLLQQQDKELSLTNAQIQCTKQLASYYKTLEFSEFNSELRKDGF